jgi:hypothetical protein
VYRIEDLPSALAARVQPASDPASWVTHCACAHDAQWVAWNVREDIWFRAQDLARIAVIIDRDDPTAQHTGAELLLLCAPSLQRLRDMSPAEQALLPTRSVTHVMERWLWNGYDLAPDAAWDEGGLSGETSPPPLTMGRTFRVTLKPNASRAKWVTFATKGCALPSCADDIAQQLGLAWDATAGMMVRIEVPLAALRASGARFFLPSVFDSIGSPRRPLWPDWRARPQREQRADEPWGSARDMMVDGPALPEVIVEITPGVEMDAKCIDTLRTRWSDRPYLRGTAPR